MQVDSVLRFWDFDEAKLRADPNVLDTLNNSTVRNYDGAPMPMGWILGGIKRDASGRIVSAEVLQASGSVWLVTAEAARRQLHRTASGCQVVGGCVVPISQTLVF